MGVVYTVAGLSRFRMRSTRCTLERAGRALRLVVGNVSFRGCAMCEVLDMSMVRNMMWAFVTIK